ncbi:hypothetical protein NDU88_002331 [Pleurodeles waltl]|uniref:Uncharacterized protein n=1 Tax=Pleurodeles waltl TaxID=8319 RepID=A0AAV7RE69_PLEWA|nr:hypothetical protein NDU88_002331 [Pleurodeles waltl]
MQDTLNKLLGAIEDTKLTLSQEIVKVSSELSHLRSDHHKSVYRVTTIEPSLEELQPTYRALRAKLKAILDGVTHFFQEPDEVWTWLEAYHKGHMDIKRMEHKQPRRQGKRRHARDSQKDRQVTKPMSQQAHQGKRAALQAAASLMEARSSEDGLRSEPESLNGEDTTDTESRISGLEGLPHVTPHTSEGII